MGAGATEPHVSQRRAPNVNHLREAISMRRTGTLEPRASPWHEVAAYTWGDEGGQEAGELLLDALPGATQRDATPPSSAMPAPAPAQMPIPDAGV